MAPNDRAEGLQKPENTPTPRHPSARTGEAPSSVERVWEEYAVRSGPQGFDENPTYRRWRTEWEQEVKPAFLAGFDASEARYTALVEAAKMTLEAYRPINPDKIVAADHALQAALVALQEHAL